MSGGAPNVRALWRVGNGDPVRTVHRLCQEGVWIGLWVVRPRLDAQDRPRWGSHVPAQHVDIYEKNGCLFAVNDLEWDARCSRHGMVAAREALVMAHHDRGPVIARIGFGGGRLKAVLGTFSVSWADRQGRRPLLDVSADLEWVP